MLVATGWREKKMRNQSNSLRTKEERKEGERELRRKHGPRGGERGLRQWGGGRGEGDC